MSDMTDEEFDRKCRVRAIALSYDARHTIEKLDAEITRLRSDNAMLRTAFEISEKENAEYIATLRAHIKPGKVLADTLGRAMMMHSIQSSVSRAHEVALEVWQPACNEVIAYLRGEKP